MFGVADISKKRIDDLRLRGIGAVNWESQFSRLYKRKIDVDVIFAGMKPARWRLPLKSVYLKPLYLYIEANVINGLLCEVCLSHHENLTLVVFPAQFYERMAINANFVNQSNLLLSVSCHLNVNFRQKTSSDSDCRRKLKEALLIHLMTQICFSSCSLFYRCCYVCIYAACAQMYG